VLVALLGAASSEVRSECSSINNLSPNTHLFSSGGRKVAAPGHQHGADHEVLDWRLARGQCSWCGRAIESAAANPADPGLNAVRHRSTKIRSKQIKGVKLLRVLTDRGSEYCGNPERHEYDLPRGRGHRPFAHQNQEPADQRHVSASTKRCSTSSTGWPCARRHIVRSMSCGPISICRSVSMSNALIRDAGASGKPRCRPSWMPCLSRRTK
jgi:hypothetical protein